MEPPKPAKFKYLREKSFLAVVKNSVGSEMFRNFYVDKNKKSFDVLRDGELSCAYFASTILLMFGLVKKIHFTVARTAEDLKDMGAEKIPETKVKPGDVIFWSSVDGKTGAHNHVGFYIGGKKAVSNGEKIKAIYVHDYKFLGTRNIELVLRPDWKNHG